MDRTRLVGCLACVLLVGALALATPAAASPQDVIADWDKSGLIDRNFSISDLTNAEQLMRQTEASWVRWRRNFRSLVVSAGPASAPR